MTITSIFDFDFIIFDCDGTLVHSEPAAARGICRALAEFGVTDCTPDGIIEQFTGSGNRDIAAHFQNAGFKIDIEKFIAIADGYEIEEVKKGIGKAPRIDGLLQSLQNRNMPICVASNAAAASSWAKLQNCALDRFFTRDQIYAGRAPNRPKPHPDVFIEAAGKWDKSKILIIEDSPTGVAAARGANMTVWGYTGLAMNRAQSGDAMQKSGAARIIGDYAELLAA